MADAMECSTPVPAERLRCHVERYAYIDTPVPPSIVKPLSPRPEVGISFNLNYRDPLRLEYANGRATTHPAVGMFGPLSHRIADVRCTGHYRAFNVLFKGTGFYRLFGMPPLALADSVSDARDVVGREIAAVHEELCEATTPRQMAEIVDRYLLSKLDEDELHLVHWMVGRLAASRGRASLCRLADSSGLSARQLERKFLEQVGISAKRYARLLRFRHAAHLKLQRQDLSWTDVSQAAGFYDHNHLVKDFRELVGATPSDYVRSLSIAPQTELWSADADGGESREGAHGSTSALRNLRSAVASTSEIYYLPTP